MARVQVIGATLWHEGTCYAVCGVGDDSRSAIAIGRCAVPPGVGARRGGRLSRIARKIAKSKALKAIARDVLRKAARMPTAQASSALLVARTAVTAARQLDDEVRRENEAPDVDDTAPDVETEEYEW